MNLGQGMPDFDGPREVVEAAAQALLSGNFNQYAPGPGVPALKQGIANHAQAFYGMDLDPKLLQLADVIRQRYPNVTEVYVRADRNTVWDPIAQVISQLGKSNLKVNAVTQPADESPSTRGRR